MKNIIFETIGNTIMFILLALFFTKGLEIVVSGEGFYVTANIFTLIFVVYMLIYGIALVILNKRQGAPLSHLVSGFQMYLDRDERESMVTLKATRAAYNATIITLPIALIAFVSAHFSIYSSDANTDLFVVGCWLFILSCIIVNITFSIAWFIEDRK